VHFFHLMVGYGPPTSLHGEQLIGKVAVNRSGGKPAQYDRLDGFLDRDEVVLDEDENYLRSEDLR
jgi:hypothetical protein